MRQQYYGHILRCKTSWPPAAISTLMLYSFLSALARSKDPARWIIGHYNGGVVQGYSAYSTFNKHSLSLKCAHGQLLKVHLGRPPTSFC